jgi:endoplasmic reticulum Man9GlcNAc2 1,2-alpha-mannosidase
MSFSVPRNVPNFNDPSRRREDDSWSSSGRSRFSHANGSSSHGGVAEKIGGIFSDRRSGLPLYKDKPVGYGYSDKGRKKGWRGKRLLVVLLLALTTLLWVTGVFGDRSTKKLDRLNDTAHGWVNLVKPARDWKERRERVKEAFKVSWAAYEKYAWGYDEFHPISKNGRQMVDNGMGWIIVDALDTMMLMNLTSELKHAREWMTSRLNYDIDHDHVNTFETTIRMLGGLLSAHYLSTNFPNMAPISVVGGSNAEDLYLEKATDLADRLLGAYDSPSGIPYASINLKKSVGIPSHADGGASSTAEATSLQLEMKYLSQLTGETNYWEKAEAVMKAVDDQGAQDGLVPIFINPTTGHFYGNNIRLGSRGDSYYGMDLKYASGLAI